MPCYNFKDVGFICGHLGEHCTDCGAPADFLCDYPVGRRKTCDRILCERCAREVGPDTHYCRDHHAKWEEFEEAGGVKRVLENVRPFRKEDRKR